MVFSDSTKAYALKFFKTAHHHLFTSELEVLTSLNTDRMTHTYNGAIPLLGFSSTRHVLCFPYLDKLKLTAHHLYNLAIVDDLQTIIRTLHRNKLFHHDITARHFGIYQERWVLFDFGFCSSYDTPQKLFSGSTYVAPQGILISPTDWTPCLQHNLESLWKCIYCILEPTFYQKLKNLGHLSFSNIYKEWELAIAKLPLDSIAKRTHTSSIAKVTTSYLEDQLLDDFFHNVKEMCCHPCHSPSPSNQNLH